VAIPEQDLRKLLIEAYWEGSGSKSDHGTIPHLVHVEQSKYLFGGKTFEDPYFNVPIDLEKLGKGIEKIIEAQSPTKLTLQWDVNLIPYQFKDIPFAAFIKLFDALGVQLAIAAKK
jgi:hypothetical protein